MKFKSNSLNQTILMIRISRQNMIPHQKILKTKDKGFAERSHSLMKRQSEVRYKKYCHWRTNTNFRKNTKSTKNKKFFRPNNAHPMHVSLKSFQCHLRSKQTHEDQTQNHRQVFPLHQSLWPSGRL